MHTAPAILGSVLIASLVGSLHCAGMCGGLVLFATGSDGKLKKRTNLHVAYHLGRGIAYTALGIGAGALGAAVDIASALSNNTRTSALLAGTAMVALGIIALAHNAGLTSLRLKLPRRLSGFIETVHRAAFGLPPFHRAFVVGGLTPLLPCGWLYAFVIVAAGTGSAVMGGAVMLAFWLGTVPLLASLGIGLQGLTAPLRRRLPLVTSMLVIGLGLMTALGRVSLPTTPPDVGLGSAETRLTNARALTHDDLPCCNPIQADEPTE